MGKGTWTEIWTLCHAPSHVPWHRLYHLRRGSLPYSYKGTGRAGSCPRMKTASLPNSAAASWESRKHLTTDLGGGTRAVRHQVPRQQTPRQGARREQGRAQGLGSQAASWPAAKRPPTQLFPAPHHEHEGHCSV